VRFLIIDGEERMEDFRSNPQYGRWWDIKQPRSKFNGALQIGDDNLEELVIRGKESRFMLLDHPPDPTTMWGKLTSGPMTDISIFQARSTRAPTKTYPPKEERETEVAFSASHILVGAHVKTVDDPFIDRVLFGLSGLEEWCNATGFSGRIVRRSSQPRASRGKPADTSVNVSFQTSVTRFFNIGGGRRLRFLSLYRGLKHFDREKQVELKERNRIEIVFPKRVSVEQALDEVRLWQTFISFGLRISTFLDDIAVVRQRGRRLERMGLFVPEYKWEMPKRQRYGRLVLFNQSKLGNKIGKRLREWRESQDRIGMTVLLFRGACYIGDLHPH
jgi:hypothetical protein